MTGAAPERQPPGEATSLRIDKWLFHARFFKTRSLAAKLVSEGKLRVDGTPISKPSRTVSPGDTLTFPKDRHIRVIRIVALGTRRGPAPEAQALYEDLAPPERPSRDPGEPKADVRPTARDRRIALRMRGKSLE
ncbi:RNA-binding S4 domain-containing protein [Vannielia litorea]|uniref:RNA-binding S4 domain-containing protein n=1 Tax=Vannielia TaxID=2813041 RepID=UPI001C96E552|nr:RNA-binding S4 domain-containing protein [Vannielia litorea]MBY6046453.1 RNA-binding S4 domain-containing protein [Vannielia litorea]MBY6073866.1 RNA-binding S4 domain-containing protein [Vannielia litorea]